MNNLPTKNKKQTDVRVDLPDEVLVLRPLVESFHRANDREKPTCEWHRLCESSQGYKRWRKQHFDISVFRMDFSRTAARAYSALFDLSPADLPECAPSRVVKISQLSSELMGSLPHPDLLPGIAQEPTFQQGFADLQRWRPSDLPEGVSRRGDPLRRWMIRKIAEEFCYAFNEPPSVAVVFDLIRLGWPDLKKERSIRNTLTGPFLSEVEKTVTKRREAENRRLTAANQPAIKGALPVYSTASQGEASEDFRQAPQYLGEDILTQIEHLAWSLPAGYSPDRILASIRVTRDEAGYPQDNDGEPGEGN